MKTFGAKVLENIDSLSKEDLKSILGELLTRQSNSTNIIHSISQGLFFVGRDFSVIRINNIAKKYLISQRRYSGKNIISLIANRVVKEKMEKILKRSRLLPHVSHYLEFSIFEKKEVAFGMTRFPFYNFEEIDENGYYKPDMKQPIGSIVVITDITQLKKMYWRQTQENSMASLNMLMASIAHEIKNPLAALDLHLQLISRSLNKNKAPHKKELSDLVDIIKVEISRIDQISNDFLTTFRIEKSMRKNESLNRIVDNTIDVMLPRLKERNVELILNKSSIMRPFLFDKDQIHQVLINLIENAIAAIVQTDRKGIVSITTKNFTDRVVLEFKDNGCGISQSNLKKIFTPFYTSDKTGTGLGLSIVTKIVASHSGKVFVESRIGEGTTFLIEFYRDTSKNKILQLENTVAKSAHGKKSYNRRVSTINPVQSPSPSD